MADGDTASHTPIDPNMGENDPEGSHTQTTPNIEGSNPDNTGNDEEAPISPRTERLMKMMTDKMKSMSDQTKAALEEQRQEFEKKIGRA